MKKKILGAIIVTVVIFSGCSNKATVNNEKKDNGEIKTVVTDVKPIKAKTVPKLTAKEKEEIDSKVNSAVQNIDDALKSLDIPDDINVD